jgi:hypothetical protein
MKAALPFFAFDLLLIISATLFKAASERRKRTLMEVLGVLVLVLLEILFLAAE